MKIIACYSNKGGVGKTASAVNLAHTFAARGYRTLLCDLDPQNASGFYFRIKPSKKLTKERFFDDQQRLEKSIRGTDFENLDLLPANLSFRDFDIFLSTVKNARSQLKTALKPFKSDYQVVLLDCPPNISNLSESVFKAADRVIVPVIPTTLSERTLEQLNQFFDDQGFNREKIIPFFSMVQKAKRLHLDTIDRLRDAYTSFCDTTVPFCTEVEKMGIHRKPVAVFARQGVATAAYNGLFDELQAKIRF